MYQKPYAICNNFFQTDGKNQVLVQTCYKFISRLFDGQRTRKFRLKIFPVNLTPSNLEIKFLEWPKSACFFPKTNLKILLLARHLLWAFSALSFGRHSSHITPTGPRDCPEAFTGVYVHHRGWGAVKTPGRVPDILLELRIHRSKSQICQNVGVLPGGFTAPYPRGWTYTPVNASGQSLGVMWELCRPNESAEKAHRRCRATKRFWDPFLKKKHACFGHFRILISRFEGVRLVGNFLT